MPMTTSSRAVTARPTAVHLTDHDDRQEPPEPGEPGSRRLFCFADHVGAQWLRTGFQTRVPRVRFLPPMPYCCSRTAIRTMTTEYAIAFTLAAADGAGGRAVGQRPGHLIWVEGNGSSSLPSSTRRPQQALLPAERAPQSGRPVAARGGSGLPLPTHPCALRRKSARHPAQGR